MGFVDTTIEENFREQGLFLKSRNFETATTAASDIYNALIDSGKYPHACNLGQGTETEECTFFQDAFGKTDRIVPKPKYSPKFGGKDVQDVMSGFLRRCFGINVKPLVGGVPGRDGLFPLIVHYSSLGAKPDLPRKTPHIMLGKRNWGMIEDMAGNIDVGGGKILRYGIPTSDGIKIEYKDDVCFMYLNPENNPTGAYYLREAIRKTMDRLDVINTIRKEKGEQPIVLLIDKPYFQALKPNKDADIENGECYYPDSILQEVFNRNGPTKAIAVMSFSKAFGAANMGATLVFAHDELLPEVKKKLMNVAFGASGRADLMSAMAQAFAPENDPVILNHLEKLHYKYQDNCNALEETIETIEGVRFVDGSHGMIRSLEFNPEIMFGKRVIGERTGPYDINDIFDLSEFAALEHGIVTVPSGGHELRIANALDVKNYKEKAMPGLGACLTQISNAPKISSAPRISDVPKNNSSHLTPDLIGDWEIQNPEGLGDDRIAAFQPLEIL
jgi:aspartate/methionine/tyrosine aminotransferase